VLSALQRLRPPEPGSFHARQLQAWIGEVTTFRDAALGFRVAAGEAISKAAIEELAGRITQLQRQGEFLVRGELPAAFCDDVRLIVESLPQLRVPTNSYLFQIARNIYLDECKKFGRRKRGGAGTPDHVLPHPLELPDAGEAGEPEDDSLALRAYAPEQAATREPAVDPTHEYESSEFFDKFLAYLRAPLDRAAEALHLAAANGSAAAERRKLESLTAKFTRTMAVITAIGEGHTQDQVAGQLGLSRNQVKYIIELVQDAYAQFVTAAHQSPAAVSNAREQSHVP
jgi:DNA-directed RNA polymerase specialized sigma24 family protein